MKLKSVFSDINAQHLDSHVDLPSKIEVLQSRAWSQASRRASSEGGLVHYISTRPGAFARTAHPIYPSVTAKSAGDSSTYNAQGLQLQLETQVVFTTQTLLPTRITELLQVTPHLYRASAEGKAQAAALDSLAVTVDVRFRLYGLAADAG
jgi:23S rRNA (guanine745-N1)-methyltransferase